MGTDNERSGIVESDVAELAPSAEPGAPAAGAGTTYVRRIAKNASLSATGSIITQVLGPITGVITARALGAELYGIYVICTTWTGIFADFSRVGFGGDTLIRFLGRYTGEERLDKAKGAILLASKVTFILATLFTVAMFVGADWFTDAVLHIAPANHRLVADALRFFAPAIFLTAGYGLFTATLTGFQAQRYVILSNSIWGNIANLVSLLLLLAGGMKLYAGLGSSLVQDLVILVLSGIFIVKTFPGIRDRSLKPVTETKELWTFSGTIFATSLFSKYTFKLDVLFLGMFAPVEQVGIYAVALRLQPLIYMPHYAIAQIFGPVVAELFARGETGELEKLYKTVTKWTATFSIPIFLTLAIFHAPILDVFGKDFRGAVLAMIILGVGNSVADVLGLSGHVITMIGKPRVNLVNSVATTVISVALFLLLIPPYGVEGAAIAYASSLVVINLMRVAQVYRFLRIHPLQWSLWKVGASAATATAAVLAIRAVPTLDGVSWIWIPEILLFWTIYGGMTWMLGLDEADHVVVDAILRKARKKSNRK